MYENQDLKLYRVAQNYPRSWRGAKKAVYGSEAMLAGTGCHSLLLCVRVFVFFFLIRL
jgi:hypothetical protein